MTEPDDTIDPIEERQFDEIEDRWLSQLSKSTIDLEYFFSTLEALREAEENDRASFLLDLLEEELGERGDWNRLLKVLEVTGLDSRDPVDLNAAVVDLLRKQYRGSDNLEPLIDKVGLLRAIEDTAKTWKKVRRLGDLMQFDEGAVVWMEGKGAGRVTEVNFELESFKLDLEHHPGLRVGFAVAAKMLEPLPEGHFLRIKLEDPESLRRLARSSPGELLLELLKSASKPMTASEIKLHLASLIDDGKWSTWWAEARRHPRVLSSGSSSRQKYRWASSSTDAEESVRKAFDSADIDKQLGIFRKEAKRSPELVRYMSERLIAEANAALETDPARALTIQDTLARQGVTWAEEWTARDVVETIRDLPALASELADRALRERIYEIATETRENWTEELARAMTIEQDPRLLSAIASRIGERDGKALDKALDELTSQPRKHAAGFVWLVESFDQEALTGRLNPLRVMRQSFDAFHQTEFDGLRNRLLKSLEGKPAGAMIRRISEEQADQAKRAISRAPLEEHTRETLQRALEHQFPSVSRPQEIRLYATAESIEQRRKEMKNLIEVEIPANRKAIEEARELGDLRENFEYKSARQRHEYLNARLEGLQKDLERVHLFNPNDVGTDEVRLGSKVVLRSAEGEIKTLVILGPWESDPDRGVISYASELGSDLLGSTVGNEVEIDGGTFEVSNIDRP